MVTEKVYKVLIFRADGNHMEILESDDLKAVENFYNGLNSEWVESSAAKRPFQMPPPSLHSFLPALITEIKVESISKEEYNTQGNPYYQKMKKDGLSGSMNQHFNKGVY
jgi:hypothetical protein